VIEALSRHEAEYRRRFGGTPAKLYVLDRLLACRTGALGGHLLVCHDCGFRKPVYTSCDNRHCPQCGGARSAKWLEDRAERMLDVPHFQAVFTLPSELRAVAQRNPRIVYPMMARAGAGVLADLAEQRLNARLGITTVLHTWASNLTLHPHWHCLVTAGGLSLDGQQWVETRTDFLFPVKVIGRMYRGRVLQALINAHQQGELDLGDEAGAFSRTLRQVAKRHRQWGVHVEAPRDRPVLHALKYLARYVNRVAITDRRMIGVTDTQVGFRARDADSNGKQRDLWLAGHEFVRRFLLHVLPKNMRRIRHYGLYAPGIASLRLEAARALLPDRPPPGQPSDLEAEAILSRCERDIALREWQSRSCPHCGGRLSTEPLPRTTSVSRQQASARGPP
jgi:predicted RNA-binding Zn-ribbon protein involved in translation (DUF1610 family)